MTSRMCVLRATTRNTKGGLFTTSITKTEVKEITAPRNLYLRGFYLNPGSSKSDQNPTSPCNFSALLNRVVMRIKGLITQDKFY